MKEWIKRFVTIFPKGGMFGGENTNLGIQPL
jgi:hypothetical protein